MSKNPSYGLDDFNRPKILSENESIIQDILVILFSKPGSFPSQPRLGMDISRYLYSLDESINPDAIKNELINHCSDFKYIVDDGDFDVRISHYNNNPLLLFMLPVLENQKEKQLVIGVTVNNIGEMIYNYQLIEQPNL